MLKLFPSIPRKIEAKSNRIFPETWRPFELRSSSLETQIYSHPIQHNWIFNMKSLTILIYLFMILAVSAIQITNMTDRVRIVYVTQYRWHLITMFQFTLFHVRAILRFGYPSQSSRIEGREFSNWLVAFFLTLNLQRSENFLIPLSIHFTTNEALRLQFQPSLLSCQVKWHNWASSQIAFDSSEDCQGRFDRSCVNSDSGCITTFSSVDSRVN
jgi:hypothetical protein